jgi:NADH-quinone oxidoreductase subunit M
MQFVEKAAWIERFNILLLPGHRRPEPVVRAADRLHHDHRRDLGLGSDQERVAQYMGSFLILSGLMIGVFVSLDGLLFYFFFEATLIPMFIIIGVFGGPNRVYAAFKFFLYTFMGSLLTLIAIIYLYNKSGTASTSWHGTSCRCHEGAGPDLHRLPDGLRRQGADVAGAHLAAGCPRGSADRRFRRAGRDHAEAGRLRLPAVLAADRPDASHYLAPLIIVLSLIAVIYIGLVAMVQKDMKKLVAYSSIAHMGFVTLGFFIFNEIGVQGGIVQMISHGFVSGAMFLCIGVLYDRMHSREIADYGGVVNTMPKFAAFSVLFAMANCGLPATSGFVGEFMVILGAVQFNFWTGLLAATALILGAAYSLWMVKRVVFGKIGNKHVAELVDLNGREFFMLGVLAILTIYMGLYPAPFTDTLQVSVADLLQHVSVSKLPH